MEFLNFLHSRVLIFAGTLCLHYSLILNFAKVQKCSIFRDCILLWKVAQFAFRKINLLETQPRKIEKSLILPRVLFKSNLEISNLQTKIENFPSLFADLIVHCIFKNRASCNRGPFQILSWFPNR